jgi:uncharacterized protein
MRRRVFLRDEAFFWATRQGAEIDRIFRRGGELLSIDCKRSDAPRFAASIRAALYDLSLDRITVIYIGEKRFLLSDRVEAVPLERLAGGESLI